MESKTKSRAKAGAKLPVGRIVFAALIVLTAAALYHPAWLVFLSAEQQAAVARFVAENFARNNPLKGEDGAFNAQAIAAVVLLAAECWVVSLLINLVNNHLRFQSHHAETLKGLVMNLSRYAVFIFGLIYGLSIFGVNMAAVLASLGILSLVVGFGAESLIEDLITGLFIIFEGQFQVGDIISLDGFRGTVTSIGIRTTQITDLGGNIKIVNNSDIRALTNLSDVRSTAVCDVGISYDADLPTAEKAICALLETLPGKYPAVFHSAPSYVGVESLSASSVDLRVVAKVDEADIYTARRLLNRELKLALDAAHIEIPFPQVVVHQGS